MNAPALLADLEAAGILLRRDGDDLLAATGPGASLDPFRQRIREHKSELLAELLKAEIMAALNVEAEDFDRPAYLRLVAQFEALEGQGGIT